MTIAIWKCLLKNYGTCAGTEIAELKIFSICFFLILIVIGPCREATIKINEIVSELLLI